MAPAILKYVLACFVAFIVCTDVAKFETCVNMHTFVEIADLTVSVGENAVLGPEKLDIPYVNDSIYAAISLWMQNDTGVKNNYVIKGALLARCNSSNLTHFDCNGSRQLGYGENKYVNKHGRLELKNVNMSDSGVYTQLLYVTDYNETISYKSDYNYTLKVVPINGPVDHAPLKPMAQELAEMENRRNSMVCCSALLLTSTVIYTMIVMVYKCQR